jgi:hypothetical protein
MDNKPPIDFDKLKEYQDKKNKTEEPEEIEILGTSSNGWVLTNNGWVKKSSLTDPYYNRRQLINISDFDEWE